MNALRKKKALVTCGQTWIPIDDMRIIGNISSGKLGQIIAMDLIHAGVDVTLLEGPVSHQLESKYVKVHKFAYYDDYLKLMKREAGKNYDIIVHAAAVSDYKLKKTFKTKLSSELNELVLDLVPTKKIINTIKKLNPSVCLIGFKLVSKISKTIALEKSEPLFQKSKCDFVIANSSREGKYDGFIIDQNQRFCGHELTRKNISHRLIQVLKKHFSESGKK